jgi:hypothetical protein
VHAVLVARPDAATLGEVIDCFETSDLNPSAASRRRSWYHRKASRMSASASGKTETERRVTANAGGLLPRCGSSGWLILEIHRARERTVLLRCFAASEGKLKGPQRGPFNLAETDSFVKWLPCSRNAMHQYRFRPFFPLVCSLCKENQ